MTLQQPLKRQGQAEKNRDGIPFFTLTNCFGVSNLVFFCERQLFTIVYCLRKLETRFGMSQTIKKISENFNPSHSFCLSLYRPDKRGGHNKRFLASYVLCYSYLPKTLVSKYFSCLKFTQQNYYCIAVNARTGATEFLE